MLKLLFESVLMLALYSVIWGSGFVSLSLYITSLFKNDRSAIIVLRTLNVSGAIIIAFLIASVIHNNSSVSPNLIPHAAGIILMLIFLIGENKQSFREEERIFNKSRSGYYLDNPGNDKVLSDLKRKNDILFIYPAISIGSYFLSLSIPFLLTNPISNFFYLIIRSIYKVDLIDGMMTLLSLIIFSIALKNFLVVVRIIIRRGKRSL